MSKEEILEGNRLIAEFMGATIDQYNNVRFVLPADGIGLAGCGLHACRYHSSWDWLMPVVEKIEKFDEGVCSVFIAGTDCDIAFSSKYNKDGEDYDAPNFRKSSEDKMKSTWQAVVQFVQWYNTPKK